MDIIGGLVALILLASYLALAIDVRGVRKDQREYLDAILTELRRIRTDRRAGSDPSRQLAGTDAVLLEHEPPEQRDGLRERPQDAVVTSLTGR